VPQELFMLVCRWSMVLLMVCLALPQVARGQVVRIDATSELQVMDGFGGFGGKRTPWSEPPIWDEDFVRLMIDDLGLTILRMEVPTSFEPVRADGRKTDQGHFSGEVGPLDLSGYNIDQRLEGHHLPLATQLPYIRAMKRRADEKGEPLLLIASIWSPPPWMKYIDAVGGKDRQWNRLSDGSHLQPNYYPKFAQYCEAYVRTIQRECGVEVYALSLQNEPFFAQSFQSCVYNPRQYREVVRAVGRHFQEQGITTRLFGPEDVPEPARIAGYVSAACEDPQTRDMLEILAVHGYGDDGMGAANATAATWRQAFDIARRYNKRLWMTETGGYADDWAGAMKLAEAIHTALKEGRVSAWVWWSLSEPKGSANGLTINGRPTSRYFVSKNYYRHVRPGAVQVASESDDPDVLVTAFKHPRHNTLTLVLINRSRQARAVTLAAAGLPAQLRAYQTTSRLQCEEIGQMPSDRPVQLPPLSVTTLVGADYAAGMAAGPPVIRTQPQLIAASEGETAEFSVELAGPFPSDARFQWRRDDRPIQGAVLPVYRRTNISSADAGARFTVELTNAHGRTVSQPATLNIRPFDGLLIARASTPPVIDGRSEKPWDEAAPAHAKNLVLGDLATQGLFSARVRALWDDQNLYVRYDVKDARKTEVIEGAMFLNDSVELYLDTDNSKSATYGPGDFLFIFVRGSNECVETKHHRTDGVLVVTGDQENGYRIDVQIPWMVLGVAPRAGSFIGFDAHINHGDGKTRFGKLAWFGRSDNVWESPSRMGTARLAE
jgi:glucuronoarabinoxylan endo-1,4-beta-xylanase